MEVYPQNINFNDWLVGWIQSCKDLKENSVFLIQSTAYLLLFIWKARNKVIFENESFNANFTLLDVCRQLLFMIEISKSFSEGTSVSETTRSRNTFWVPPVQVFLR
uniref:Uncharacterized protein n=1 Tax=Nelumbo nucifera TaxID=4432 RepID=A0A822ZIR6_NELNU|nr:TPA_asm: hypothetical protein HUJ06_002752 [Nelumbo nucifera]